MRGLCLFSAIVLAAQIDPERGADPADLENAQSRERPSRRHRAVAQIKPCRVTRAMQPGLRTATLCEVGAFMGAGALRGIKSARVKDQNELPSVQRRRDNLSPVECIEPAGMNPAR